MSNNRLIVRLLAPLAVALFVVAITIGLSQPTLVETADGAVVCASAFGTGDISGATEAGQASCAALTSERQMWSFSLLGASLGLLFGVFWVALSTSHRDSEELPGAGAPPSSAQPSSTQPASAQPATEWVDYPAAGPVDDAPAAIQHPAQQPGQPGQPQDPQQRG